MALSVTPFFTSMSFQNFSSLEPLESRIAPAGVVTVTFMDGVLTIGGADGADHSVEVVKTGLNSFRVDGTDTGINVVGTNSKDFRGVLKHVQIEGGAGADVLELTNLRPLKSLVFEGNEGVDSLTTNNLRTRGVGTVDIALGSEAGSVDFTGAKTVINGELKLDLGGGGTVALRSEATTVRGAVEIIGGEGSDVVTISGGAAHLNRELSFTTGNGDDSFTAEGKILKVKGAISMLGEGGTNHFTFAAEKNEFGKTNAPGVMDLKVGTGPGSVSFRGESTVLLANLQIDLGAGGGTANVNSAVTQVRDGVTIAGGAGNDAVNFEGRASIGKTISFLGGEGDDSLVAKGGLFAVKGLTNVDGGSGASTFELNVTKVDLRALSVTGGTSNDTVRIVADGTISGDVNLQLGLDGTGPSSVILQSRTDVANRLVFGGALTVDMRGDTVDVLRIANIQVAKDLVAQTGENVSTVDLSRVNVKANLTLRTGSGADVINLDNLSTRDFSVDTESGADELRIERSGLYTGTSKVLGVATILTGIGADQIRIGDASDPANLKVSFLKGMSLDAGDGENMRNDIVASNFFSSAPSIVATGGTLTQTEAV